MISEEAKAELRRMFAERKDPDRPLEQRRREWEEEALQRGVPAGASHLQANAGGVPAEWTQMPGVAHDRVFLWLHGGGYNAGSPRIYRLLAAELSEATGMRVLTPDYRLAPEHPFPAGVEDAVAAYDWLRAEGIEAANIVVGGDSAGGGLTLSMLLRLREIAAPMPNAAVLLAPWTDLTVSGDSYESLRHLDPIITREGLREAGIMYAGDHDPADPRMSPLFADLVGLPPMLIHAGGDEAMLDDSRIFAERAKAGGVDVAFKIHPGMWHVFHGAGRAIPEARSAIAEIGDFVRARLFA